MVANTCCLPMAKTKSSDLSCRQSQAMWGASFNCNGRGRGCLPWMAVRPSRLLHICRRLTAGLCRLHPNPRQKNRCITKGQTNINSVARMGITDLQRTGVVRQSLVSLCSNVAVFRRVSESWQILPFQHFPVAPSSFPFRLYLMLLSQENTRRICETSDKSYSDYLPANLPESPAVSVIA